MSKAWGSPATHPLSIHHELCGHELALQSDKAQREVVATCPLVWFRAQMCSETWTAIAARESYRDTLTATTLSYPSWCSCYAAGTAASKLTLSFPLAFSYLHTFSFTCPLKLISASRSASDWALSGFLGDRRARLRTENETDFRVLVIPKDWRSHTYSLESQTCRWRQGTEGFCRDCLVLPVASGQISA